MRRRDFLIAGASASVAGSVLPALPVGAAPCPPGSLSIQGGTSVQTSCDAVTPGPSANPAYLNSLAPFAVRLLTAPSNGKATIESVTPSEWLNSDPGITDLASVLSAWCGGIGDGQTGRLYIVGGGHADSANNGIYCYDFSGTAAPTGFSLLAGSQSAVAAVPQLVQGTSAIHLQYSDGRPSSRHTYDGVVFANNRLYLFGGGPWGSGGFSRDTWRFDSGVWSRMPDPPFGSDRPWTAYDPSTGKVLYFTPGSESYGFFNTATGTWGTRKQLSRNFGAGDAVLCHDTTRKRVFVMGSGYNFMWTVNWSAESIAEGTYSPSSILADPGVTPLYDPVRDRFWILGGRTAGPGYTTLFEMHPSTFAITPHTLSGDSIPTAASNGTFKRAVLLGNAIGFVSVVNGPAIAIRLPA